MNEQTKERAVNEELPNVVWTGTFKLFGVDVVCHQLDNNVRVIESESLYALMKAMGTVEPDASSPDELMEIMAFASWRSGAQPKSLAVPTTSAEARE